MTALTSRVLLFIPGFPTMATLKKGLATVSVIATAVGVCTGAAYILERRQEELAKLMAR